jgi:Cu-processing system ATP-binding protein
MDNVVFEGVGKRYRSLWALRGVEASFRAGEVVMLIGPNGSGKTTLIKCLLGLVAPSEGRVLVGGTVVGRDPAYRRGVGYMPQISQFPPALTIGQLLDMMLDVRGMRAEDADDGLVAALGLDRQLDKRLSTLSGGTCQKVSAVLACRSRPSVLVMDEPTAGLDPLSARTVLDQAANVRARGGTVLITSHLLEEVEALADRVAYIQDGQLRFLLPMAEILARSGASRLAQALPILLSAPDKP